jgi:hypothetical protein
MHVLVTIRLATPQTKKILIVCTLVNYLHDINDVCFAFRVYVLRSVQYVGSVYAQNDQNEIQNV